MAVDSLFPPIDFVAFHRDELPTLLERHSALVGSEVERGPTLAFKVGDAAFTYGPGPQVAEGAGSADTVAVLSPETWSEFAHELRSCFGLMIGDMVEFERGDFATLVRWEPALRALWQGRPVYDPADLDGVDLHRSFAVDDPPDDIRQFLHRTGFVHVRGVFSPEEMKAVGAEIERLAGEATFDDGRSWWGKRADGSDVCCRLIYAGEKSPLVHEVCADDRLRALVDLTGPGLLLDTDRLDGESVVIKPAGVVEGLADLPWHRDCGMGGHPVLCPGVNLGIQVDAATPDNGQLHFLAGSWRSSGHAPRPGEEESLPVVAVTTEPGDVTVHFGHVLHAAPPPSGDHDGRRTLYASFHQPLVREVVPPGQGYNDVVLAKRGRVGL